MHGALGRGPPPSWRATPGRNSQEPILALCFPSLPLIHCMCNCAWPQPSRLWPCFAGFFCSLLNPVWLLQMYMGMPGVLVAPGYPSLDLHYSSLYRGIVSMLVRALLCQPGSYSYKISQLESWSFATGSTSLIKIRLFPESQQYLEN